MTDVIDEIISKLSPRVLHLIENSEPKDDSPEHFNHKVENTLREFENIKINRRVRDVQNQTKFLEPKTSENKAKLLRYQKELVILKKLMETTENVQKNDKYDQMIHEIEAQLLTLMKSANDMNPLKLFEEVNKLHEQIMEYRNKITVLQKKVKPYEGLPPSIPEAKKAIAEVKERIQVKNCEVENNILMNL